MNLARVSACTLFDADTMPSLIVVLPTRLNTVYLFNPLAAGGFAYPYMVSPRSIQRGIALSRTAAPRKSLTPVPFPKEGCPTQSKSFVCGAWSILSDRSIIRSRTANRSQLSPLAIHSQARDAFSRRYTGALKALARSFYVAT